MWRKTSDIYRFINSGENPSLWEHLADVDWSGEVDENDVRYLLRVVAGDQVLLTRPAEKDDGTNNLAKTLGGAFIS